MGFINKLFEGKELKKYTKAADAVIALEDSFRSKTDEELMQMTPYFKGKLENGASLNDILPEAFATVREVSDRVLKMRHFPVQLIGGAILHDGNIAEMKTGEGKTLVATLPVYLNALSGKGVHVITVNDYLASRDAEWMGQIYKFLGLSVGLVVHGMTPAEKRAAYLCDVTYGTNNEYGFDYLRDNMVISKKDLVQRKLNYAIIDEVDSILIDEARTPLIISGSGAESTKLYTQADSFVARLRIEDDYKLDEKDRTVTLTEEGVKKAERNFGIENLTDLENMELLHHINQALKARYIMKRDIDYIVSPEKEIIIVDEFTGRLMPGRRYNEGLHQAIEAKEKVRVAKESVTLATITFQNYFRMYDKLAGMTGTAKTEEEEFRAIYGMDVYCVPTNKPMIRADLNDLIYKTEQAKFNAVVEEIAERHKTGQPILVGTISVEKSEALSKMLKRTGIAHNVLNAKNHQREAEIISQAGQAGSVTISTNMAGRGTDIVLGEGVTALGGLHILGTERHESRRIDNQLRGRAGRQGDPGSSQFFISLQDDLMRLFGSERTRSIADKMGLADDEAIEAGILTKGIESAQKTVEGRNFGIRKHVLQYDDVMNKQREVIYAQRREVLEGANIKSRIDDMIEETTDKLLKMYAMEYEELAERRLDELSEKIKDFFNVDLSFSENETYEEIEARTKIAVINKYAENEQLIGSDAMRELERVVLLQVVDSKWMDHIDNMDQLRQGISLRAYGQTDPVQAYTSEGFEMFEAMNDSILDDTVKYLYKIKIKREAAPPKPTTPKVPDISPGEKSAGQTVKANGNIPKNAKCPCGSGKKYKQCCGKDLFKND